MPRLTLSSLSRASCASTLSAELLARLSHQRERLRSLEHIAGIRPAIERLHRGCAEAEAASSPTAAVARLEAGTGAVVESLRDAAEPEAAHAVLQCAFSTLIRARAIGWRHAELTSGEDDGGGLFAPGSVELARLVEDGLEDAAAFCREKHGAAPEVELTVADSAPAGRAADETLLLAPFVAFPLHELLKNAMGAHVRRCGGDAG